MRCMREEPRRTQDHRSQRHSHTLTPTTHEATDGQLGPHAEASAAPNASSTYDELDERRVFVSTSAAQPPVNDLFSHQRILDELDERRVSVSTPQPKGHRERRQALRVERVGPSPVLKEQACDLTCMHIGRSSRGSH